MIAPMRPADPPRAWTVSDLLVWTEDHFRKKGFSTPRLDAEILLAHALGCMRLDLYVGYHKVVEPPERERFRAFIERRGQGEPVAYITGSREFHSLPFEVGPAVLIPRPETEHLVDAAIEHILSSRRVPDAADGAASEADGKSLSPLIPQHVLDLGTGSGNIAVAIAVERPAARVVAVDISPEALEVARRNAARNGVQDRIEFRQGDLFEALAGPGPSPRFDAIVSNPPYVSAGEYEGLDRGVKNFEPRLALLDSRSEVDGDCFHRAIAARATDFLAPGGLLALEVGAGQSARVQSFLHESGFARIRAVTDLGGIERVVMGVSPPE